MDQVLVCYFTRMQGLTSNGQNVSLNKVENEQCKYLYHYEKKIRSLKLKRINQRDGQKNL